MSSALFILIYGSILLIPGAALDKMLHRDKPHGPLVWTALSYGCFVLIFISGNYWQLSADGFCFIIAAVLLISVFILLKNPHPQTASEDWKTPCMVLLLVSGAYQIFVGSYNEVPADLYNHLERFQHANKQLADGTLGDKLSGIQLFRQKTEVFYYLVAFANQWPGLDTRTLVEWVDFSNRTLFLLAVFCFARMLFKHTAQSNLIAALTVAFVALHMGISVFAYVRYYSFAPTMLAMIIYFSTIALFLEYLKTPFKPASFLITSTLLLGSTLAAAAVHTQEALFIAIIVLCISLVVSASHIKAFKIAAVDGRSLANLISIVGIVGFAAFYFYFANHARGVNLHRVLWEFGDGPWLGLSFMPPLSILNLKFQFMQVATLWGVLVYILFFLHIKRYRNNLFLMAAMLSPLLTFLNPFFIDVFLKHYRSLAIWRLCYLLPLHFVAADLLLYYAHSIKNQALLKKGISVLIVALLLLLLAPINNTWRSVHYSRAPTLVASKISVSYAHYNDLLDFLNSLESTDKVLTDPTLGYMISGLTHHYSARKRFFSTLRNYQHFSYAHYDDNPLDKYAGYLLIVNQRDSGESDVGRLGGHWRKNHWAIVRQKYYPQALLEHLRARPAQFKPLWSNNGVAVYQIGANFKQS